MRRHCVAASLAVISQRVQTCNIAAATPNTQRWTLAIEAMHAITVTSVFFHLFFFLGRMFSALEKAIGSMLELFTIAPAYLKY